MSGTVTLPSANGVVTVQSGSGTHEFVAQIIANSILMASVSGSGVNSQSVTITGATQNPTPTPAVVPGEENILYLYGAGGPIAGSGSPIGSFSVPSGYQYVVDLMTGP
jgi:hypothetical protein